MLWFYQRDKDAIRLDTSYDNNTLEYVTILHLTNGQQESRRFDNMIDFRRWLVALETRLAGEGWALAGPPHILPDGWPDKTPQK